MALQAHTIAVIGGTGAQGNGLASRWARAGHRIRIGSRDAARAEAAAAEMTQRLGGGDIRGHIYADAVRAADIVVLSVPFAAEMPIVEELSRELQGKILIDVTAPLVPPKVSRVQLPASDSCVVAVQALLGDGVRVVSAFQNVAAHKLQNLDEAIDCDVLVTADDKEARQIGIALATAAGLRGVDAGPLANSVVAESLTSALIWINRTYKLRDAGIRITGLA